MTKSKREVSFAGQVFEVETLSERNKLLKVLEAWIARNPLPLPPAPVAEVLALAACASLRGEEASYQPHQGVATRDVVASIEAAMRGDAAAIHGVPAKLVEALQSWYQSERAAA